MRRIKMGDNFTVFLLFFGVGLLEAIRSASWLSAAFWIAMGAAFLAADNLKRRT